jgi:hypothetical protein
MRLEKTVQGVRTVLKPGLRVRQPMAISHPLAS